jgi:tetratricopeptide (TPR) repeat protein
MVYPLVGAIVAALVWAGFFHEGEPDLGTLIHGADILAKVGAHDKAILECEKVLERDPGNLQAHLIFAWSLDQLGHDAESLDHYRISLDLAGEQDLADLALDIRLTMADLHRRYGRFEEAVQACSRIEKEFGSSSRLNLVRGLALEELGRVDEALELYRDAVVQGPDETLPRLCLGMACRKAGLLEEAQQSFLALAERGAAGPTPWFHLASLRAESGDREGMFDALAEAASRNRAFTHKSVLEDEAFGPYLQEETFQEFLVELDGESPRSL